MREVTEHEFDDYDWDDAEDAETDDDDLDVEPDEEDIGLEDDADF